MGKLTEAQAKGLRKIIDWGHLSVTYWGGRVSSMRPRINDGTLQALYRKGCLSRKVVRGFNSNRYEPTPEGRAALAEHEEER